MRASRLLTCSYFLHHCTLIVAHRTHFPYNKLSGALPVVFAIFDFLETFGCECSHQVDPAIAQEATTLREQSDYLERTIHVSYTRFFHFAFLFLFNLSPFSTPYLCALISHTISPWFESKSNAHLQGCINNDQVKKPRYERGRGCPVCAPWYTIPRASVRDSSKH